jgi:hypothetical protein
MWLVSCIVGRLLQHKMSRLKASAEIISGGGSTDRLPFSDSRSRPIGAAGVQQVLPRIFRNNCLWLRQYPVTLSSVQQGGASTLQTYAINAHIVCTM